MNAALSGESFGLKNMTLAFLLIRRMSVRTDFAVESCLRWKINVGHEHFEFLAALVVSQSPV